MRWGFSSRFSFALMFVWLAGSVFFLLMATASALRDPGVPLVVGLVNTRGVAAVCAVFLPALCGLSALVGIVQRRPWAPVLSLLYCLFWLATLGGGLLVGAIHGGLFALERISLRGWIIGGILFASLVAAFLFTAVWSARHLSGGVSPRSAS